MTASVRAQIVSNVVTTLQGINGTGSYNHTVRYVTHWEKPPTGFFEYPALVVADVQEAVDQKVYDLHSRELVLIITGTLIGNQEPGDTVPTDAAGLIADIERALQTDITRGGKAVNTRTVRNETYLGDPSQPYVVIEVEVHVDYRTSRTDPNTAY